MEGRELGSRDAVDIPLVEAGLTFEMFDDQFDEGFLVLRSDEQSVVLDADAVGFRFSRRPNVQSLDGEWTVFLNDAFGDQADALQAEVGCVSSQ